MDDFSKHLKKKLENPDFRKEFMRIRPYSDLANQLILLRNRLGLSQQEVANRMNTTQTVISRLENASGNPSYGTIQKYAEALNSYIKIEVIPDADFRYSDFFLEEYFTSSVPVPDQNRNQDCINMMFRESHEPSDDDLRNSEYLPINELISAI